MEVVGASKSCVNSKNVCSASWIFGTPEEYTKERLKGVYEAQRQKQDSAAIRRVRKCAGFFLNQTGQAMVEKCPCDGDGGGGDGGGGGGGGGGGEGCMTSRHDKTDPKREYFYRLRCCTRKEMQVGGDCYKLGWDAEDAALRQAYM